MQRKKKPPKDHEFSLSSGQMVGLIVGQVVIVLIAFVAGLLVGRYDMARELVDLAREGPGRTRMAVPLTPPTTSAANVPKSTSVDEPGKSGPPRESGRPAPVQRTQQPGPAKAERRTAKVPVPSVKPDTAPKPEVKPKQQAKPPVAPTDMQSAAKPQPPAPEVARQPDKPSAPAEKPPAPKPGTQPQREKTATVEPEKPPVRGEYCVQVFASRSAGVAARYAGKLEQDGLEAWVKPPASPSGDVWHRVMVGRFPTKAEAAKAMTDLKRGQKFTDAFVRPAR